MRCTPRSYPDLDTLSRAAAEFIVHAAEEDARTRGCFSLALSGGNTPRTLFRLLAAPPWSMRMPWSRTHIFWGDERCVPPERVESNYFHAWKLLLSRVPVPNGNIHRIRAEWGGDAAAIGYQRDLEDFFLSTGGKRDYFHLFDCMLLGMGGDGHIASLFPGATSLDENIRWVLPATAPEGVFPRERITLTLPVIDRAKRLIFLVSGAGKRDILGGVLSDSPQAGSGWPVTRVNPRGECVFLTDFVL